jgi:hypothetical protein
MEDGPRQLTQSDIISVDSTQQNQIGAMGYTADGRQFVYALIGGTATVVPGTVLYQPTDPTNSTGLALSTANTTAQLTGTGSPNATLLVVNGATAVTANQFADSFLEIIQTSGTANGPTSYRILGNSAAAAAGTITVTLADPLTNTSVLVPGTDVVNFKYSVYAGSVATTTTSVPAGVLRVQVPNTAALQNYAWLQTQGESIVTLDATTGGITLGGALYQSTTTAGAVSKTAPTLANGVVGYPIGIARATSAASTTVSIYIETQ